MRLLTIGTSGKDRPPSDRPSLRQELRDFNIDDQILQELVEGSLERRRVGAASRAYVEHVHDVERVADRLLDLYAGVQ